MLYTETRPWVLAGHSYSGTWLLPTWHCLLQPQLRADSPSPSRLIAFRPHHPPMPGKAAAAPALAVLQRDDAAGRGWSQPVVGRGCQAPRSRCFGTRKWLEGSDNVRMREVIGAIERVSSRPRFSHGATFIVCRARAWRAKYNPGPREEGSSLGFAFPSLCTVGSGADKGRVVPGLVSPRWWVLPAWGLCPAQEDAPAQSP